VDQVTDTAETDERPEGIPGLGGILPRHVRSRPMQHDGWNLADVWEAHADRFPDAPAQVQGGRRFTWAEMDRRADGVARALLDAGAQRQDKVAHYLYNSPEYLESLFALFKASLVPVNTNYRYGDDELVYLWTNADAVAVVFHGTFAERVEQLRDRVPGVHTWLHVDDGSGPCPEWAVPYEQAASSTPGRTQGPWGRSGDDLYLLYTGGTTGMPKGVMWRQDDILMSLEAPAKHPLPDVPSLDAVHARVAKHRGVQRHERARPRRVHRDPGGPPLRPGGAARHHRA
jgi:3-oxocholest-4-en-26-oate---CoA ligase